MPKSFDLTCKEGYYSQFFNTANNLDYVCPHPEPKHYGAEYISSDELALFLKWSEELKGKIFCSKPTARTMSMY